MKISNELHALVARKEERYSRCLNCLIVNILFSNDPVKSSMLPDRCRIRSARSYHDLTD